MDHQEFRVEDSKLIRSAANRIIAFTKRFGESHLLLAYHAAFPLAITPDLLYRIWANFTPSVPWIATADILLSRLCKEVGFELYEMDPNVRGLLINEMKEDPRFGQTRVDQLADFLISYISSETTSQTNEIKGGSRLWEQGRGGITVSWHRMAVRWWHLKRHTPTTRTHNEYNANIIG